MKPVNSSSCTRQQICCYCVTDALYTHTPHLAPFTNALFQVFDIIVHILSLVFEPRQVAWLAAYGRCHDKQMTRLHLGTTTVL